MTVVQKPDIRKAVGANPDMKDRGGRTAMDAAARAFRPRCRAILTQHQTSPAE